MNDDFIIISVIINKSPLLRQKRKEKRKETTPANPHTSGQVCIPLNDKMISDEKFIISDKLFQNDYLKLSIGKKRHIKIEKD